MTGRESIGAPQPRLDGSLIAAITGNFLIRLDGGMVGMLLTLYLADVSLRGIIPVTATTLGIITSAYYIIELVFSPVMGAKSDQHGNRALLLVAPLVGVIAALIASVTVVAERFDIVGLTLAGISIVLLALATTRLLQGLAAATSIPSILSYLSAHTEGSLAMRGRVMSIFEVTTAVGLLLGPILGAQLWGLLGPWGFTVTAALFLLAGGVFWVVRDDRETAHLSHQVITESLGTRLGRVLRRGDLLGFAPAWLAINAVVGLWGTHLIYQMRAGSQVDEQYLTGFFDGTFISLALAGSGTLVSIGIIAWGFSFGRLQELTVMRLSLIGLFGLALSVYGINHASDNALLRASFVGLAAIALLVQSGFAPAAITFLARLAARSVKDRGLFMGIYSVVLGLGQFVGHTLGGPFADRWGVDGIILLTLILGLIATFTVLRLSPRPDNEETSTSDSRISIHA